MFQKFLEGKKKYSAYIITVLGTLVPLLFQEPETQKTIMDMVPSIAVLIAGIFYLMTEGGLDKEREKSKAAVAQATIAANGSTAAGQGGAQAASAQPQQPSAAPQVLPEPPPVPFDVKAFHEDVMATVKATYTEVNPCTIFYKARDKGQVTDCQAMSQAEDYWAYLVDLAVDARDWIKAETEKPAGACGRSPEYYVFSQDFSQTLRSANNLAELAKTTIDWKRLLASFNRTLYGVGNLAGQLLGTSG